MSPLISTLIGSGNSFGGSNVRVLNLPGLSHEVIMEVLHAPTPGLEIVSTLCNNALVASHSVTPEMHVHMLLPVAESVLR